MSYIDKIEIAGTEYDIKDNTAVPLAGGTMTGALVLSGDPTEDNGAATKAYVDAIIPTQVTTLPASGTALTANTIYNVTGVNTYSFVAPTSNWAHGIFVTGDSPALTFDGKVIGSLPTFAANSTYEFDVYQSMWIVQEVTAQ